MPVKKEAVLAKTVDGKYLIKITFPYNIADLDVVRSLPLRHYHSDGKFWTCPVSLEAVQKLRDAGFELHPKLLEYLEQTTKTMDEVQAIEEVPGLKGRLFHFQAKGVGFIEAKSGRVLIADEMGLGKTIQALAWLQLHSDKRPAVVVCPASLKLNWKRETERWLSDPKVQVLSGTAAQPINDPDIVVVNYDILEDWLETLLGIHPQVLVIDECHLIKNGKAKRTKATIALGKAVPHVIALSGTPVINRPIEVYNALRLVNPTLFPNFWDFAQKYCGARHNGFGWDFRGASNTEELHKILSSTVMIRRLKSEVLQDLPDKIRTYLPFEISNLSEYQEAEANFIEWLRQERGEESVEKASRANMLVKIEALKQLAVKGKLSQALEWVENFIETDGKLVVFAVHREVVDTLCGKFKDVAVKVDGSVSGEDRDKAVQEFQNNDKIRLFVGNIKAAGVGLTLTAASSVAFLELPWTPGELDQAEDRVHRIGQRESVNIYYLLANGTIEEKIASMLDRKRRVVDAVIDGKETEQESLLTELINAYKGNEIQ